MSDPATILINTYPVLQNLVSQKYNSIYDVNIYDRAIRTQNALNDYIVVNFINYSVSAISTPHFVNQIIYKNPNILLFFAQNPNLMTYFSNPSNLITYTDFLTVDFINDDFGFIDIPSNPKTDIFCFIKSRYPSLSTYLSPTLSQNCPENGIIQIHTSIFGTTPNITKLLSSYPLLNYLVNQNYMYEIYYNYLFNNANLVNLLLVYPALLYTIILNDIDPVNPNILNLLGYYTNLTYDFNFDFSDAQLFLNLPGINDINHNLTTILETTTLRPYLESTLLYPIFTQIDSFDLQKISLLNNYPSLNIVIHQNYNDQLYTNIFNDTRIITLLTFAISQYNLNLITPIYEGFPNIITDIINFNPNLLAFFYDNPNLTEYLSTNTKVLYDFLIFKGSETYNIKNPMTDLYNSFASPFLSIKNLSYLLNADPNPQPTNGITNVIGNGSSSILGLYNNDVSFFYLFNQNYTFNTYYNKLYYNRILLDMLTNVYYDKNTNTIIPNYFTVDTYNLLLNTIYANPNIINYLSKNPRFLVDFICCNETNLLIFLNFPNISIPYYDINDIIFQYDIENGTSYASYLESSYNTFFQDGSKIYTLIHQNYDIYEGVADPLYIPSNYNNGQNIYHNLYKNSDLFIHFTTYFLDQQAMPINIIDLISQNPNILTFLSNHYLLLFYFKSAPLDFYGFIQFQNNSATLPTTDLVALTIAYSTATYPDQPFKVSQYLNTNLPISGPYSGIGNNPEVLDLLQRYPTLNTLCTSNYNYNLFYYHLYNNNNTNIVSFINTFPQFVPIIEKNPLFLHFFYQNQHLVDTLIANPSNISTLSSLTIIDQPYIDIFQLLLNHPLYIYMNTYKSMIENNKNIHAILSQPYIYMSNQTYRNIYQHNCTSFSVNLDVENAYDEKDKDHLQQNELIQFIYYAIEEYVYHNKINPTQPFYPYPHILDIATTNPNLFNFFAQYKHARNYLQSNDPAIRLLLRQLLNLPSITDPYTNLYDAFKSYGISEGYSVLVSQLEMDVYPFVATYTSAMYDPKVMNHTRVYLSENIELLLTYPKIQTLVKADYNKNLYYEAIYGSKILQDILLKYINDPAFTRILYQNPNIILFLYHHPTLAYQIWNDDAKYLIFISTPNVEKILSNLEEIYEQTSLNIYVNEYISTFLDRFPQFQNLYIQEYLNISRFQLYKLDATIISFIFYTLQLHYEDNTFPYFISILESNPHIINFLNYNHEIISFFQNPSNRAYYKLLLSYSYTIYSTNLDISNPICDLYVLFTQFKSAYTLDYTITSVYPTFNTNITNINIGSEDVAQLAIYSLKLKKLLSEYGELNTLIHQPYNSNIYYYSLQNEYTIDMINLAISKYNSLSWSVHIVYGAIVVCPNLLCFFYKNPRLVYHYVKSIDHLKPLLDYIASSPNPSTLNLYDFVFADPLVAEFLESSPAYSANVSNIGTVGSGVNDINTLSNIIYQNYNQNMYYKHLYNNRTLNDLINSSVDLQNVIAKNPNLVNFLAYYVDLTNALYTNPTDLAIFLSIANLDKPCVNLFDEINDYAPSLNVYIQNKSILYQILNGTLLGVLINQPYNQNIYFEALYKNVDLMYLFYKSQTSTVILPMIYKNPSLLIYFGFNNLLDYLQYDTTRVDYLHAFFDVPSMLTHLKNVPFKYHMLKNCVIYGGTYIPILSTLLTQDYNINTNNLNVYEKSISLDDLCDYLQYVYDKFFLITLPNIFSLLSTNPNIFNFLFKNPQIMAYHRNTSLYEDYTNISTFWQNLNSMAYRLTQNITSLLTNVEFYIYSSYYNPYNVISYELGNFVSNLVSKYPIFTNLLEQYYNDRMYQTLIYQSTAFQNFIKAFPLSIVFNAFSFNANMICFFAFNDELTTYFISNASDIYYFLNNLDTQAPKNDLNDILLYNDMNRPYSQNTAIILYTYTKNYFKHTLTNPSYAILKTFYCQLYNQQIYNRDFANRQIISFIYFYTRIFQKFSPLLPNLENIISTNPNILNFFHKNPNFLNLLSNDTRLNTTNTNVFITSYIYTYFTYTYSTLVPFVYTYTVGDPLTNQYTFVQKIGNATLTASLTNISYNIYDTGTTTELTNLINTNPKLDVLLNQLYNENQYYNALFQNKYLVQLFASSPALLNKIYLNPNILLFLAINPNLIIALLQDTTLLNAFTMLTGLDAPATNLYTLMMENKDVYGSYVISYNELYIQNFDILHILKNQFYLHEFYAHKLIPQDGVSIDHTLYHYRDPFTMIMKMIAFYYETIFVPDLFAICAKNPNLINYLFYENALQQYLIYHPSTFGSYISSEAIQLPITNLTTFTTQFFETNEDPIALEMIAYDTNYWNVHVDMDITYTNDLLILLNQNPILNELVYQTYNYNFALSEKETFYLYHVKAPNIIQLLSYTEYSILETIYQNPNLLVFLTNNPNLVNYLNAFTNEISILKSLPGINLPSTNLYDLFNANTNYSIYINGLDQFIFDNYRIFEMLFGQAYNRNLYYYAYRNSTKLIDLLYTSILYTNPTLIDLIEYNANLLLFLAMNPNLVSYLNTNIVDLQRFVSLADLIYPITNIYNTVVSQLSYLKPYLSQIPIGLNSNVGSTPSLITLLDQFENINALITQNYNQNVYYTYLYQQPKLVELLSSVESLRIATTEYNNNILAFLDFNPLFLDHLYATPADLTIFLTNNGILDPITNLYDYVVAYLPAFAPLLNESLTGIYSTIGTKSALSALLDANPKLNALIQQNYNSNIYYLDLYNQDNLVQLLSTKSTITTISSSQMLLSKIYKNPNILNFFNNNPDLTTFFLSNTSSFNAFIALEGLDLPLTNIDTLVKNNLPYLTTYLTQVSVGLNSTIGTTPSLTGLIENNVIIEMYANTQNYMENVYYIDLYKNPDLVSLMTTYGTQFDPYILQNPNILNFLASNPKLCGILLQSSEKIDIFLQLPEIHLMSTNIYEVIVRSHLYGNIDSISTILNINYFENSVPQFYNDYLFQQSFSVFHVSLFLYNALGLTIPNSMEIVRRNPNFINFMAQNPKLTEQLNLEYLEDDTYNIVNILHISNMTDPTANITSLITDYINSDLNITLSINLLNSQLPKSGTQSYIGTKSDLSLLLELEPQMNALVSQNYNENMYYKSLYYNDYLVSLLLANEKNGRDLLNLMYQNPLILNFLAYNPKLVVYLNKNLSEISLLTSNANLFNPQTNLYDTLLQTTLAPYLNTPAILLSQTNSSATIQSIIDQTYNVLYGTQNKNIYYNALQNSYVSYLIYYGENLSKTRTLPNIIDFIASNANIILFLYHNLDFTQYITSNEAAYIQFIHMPNINIATSDLTKIVQTYTTPFDLSIYLNKDLIHGGLSSNIGSTSALTALLTNNTILNNIISLNYIDNMYYLNLYYYPDLVSLITNSTTLLQYIYTNPNLINFLANHPKLVSYMLTKSEYVASFLQISNVGKMETNLEYTYVLYETLLNTYTLLRECVNQPYNLLPNIPYIYILTLKHLPILEFIYYTIQNVSSINLVSNVIYGNPNFINFLYDNPNLITYFTQNRSILENFMTLPGLDSPILDLYQLVIYYGTYTQNQNIIQQLNQSPRVVGVNSGIGTNPMLTSLLETYASLQSLINQNYNLNIYYTYLITYPSIVSLISNNFNLLYAIYKNPNIITFLGNNPRLTRYFESFPYAIELFLSIPNIDNPMYNLYTLIGDYDNLSTNDAATFQSLLNRSLYVLLDTYTDFKTLVLQFTNQMSIANPTVNQLNYQMNNTYFRALSIQQSLVDFIYINLSNPGLPNIILDKILKNPNIIGYLAQSDLGFLNTYIQSYYKDIISDPRIDDPATDIYEMVIPYSNPNPTYFENAYYPKQLITVAHENAYYNNMLVSYINIRKIFQQMYTNKMYEYSLTSAYLPKRDLLLYFIMVGDYPYLNFLVNVIPNNPHVIPFLINNPYLLQHFIDVPNHFLEFSSLFQMNIPYQNIETLILTKPLISPYLSRFVIYPNLAPSIQTLVDQPYNNAIYRNAIYSNPTLYELLLSNSVYVSNSVILNKISANPNILLLLHKNPALLEECSLNGIFFSNFLSLAYITNPYVNLYNMLTSDPIYAPYMNVYVPQNIAYTNPALDTLMSTYPNLAELLSQKYIGNDEINIYYDHLYKNANLTNLLTIYPSLVNAVLINPNVITFLSKNCANPISSGVMSLVDYLTINPPMVALFISLLPSTNPMCVNLYTIYQANATLNPYLTITNMPLLVSSPLYANIRAYIGQSYTHDLYFNALHENNGIYDFINYVYTIFTTVLPVPFKNIFTLLDNNPHILLFLSTYFTLAPYLTNVLSYDNCVRFMNISFIDRIYTNIGLYMEVNTYLNPSPPSLPSYTTPDLTTLLNNDAKLKSIVSQNYNQYIYYRNLYNHPNVVSLLLKNTDEYAALMPLIYSNPTMINFFCMYPDLVAAIYSNVNDFIAYINIVGINIASNNLIEMVGFTYLRVYLNTDYDQLLLNHPLIQSLVSQPYNHFIYYKYMNQNKNIVLLIEKYAYYTPSIVNDIIKRNPNIITFFGKNPNLVLELYNNETKYINDFLPLFGTWAAPNANNYPYTNLYALIQTVPSLAPFLSPAEPFPSYGTVPLNNLLTAYPLLKSIVQQNYNDYMYYNNLYNVPQLVDLLTNYPSFITLIYENPNIINLLSYSLYMVEKLNDVEVRTEFITYSTGKNPTYPNVAITNEDYLYSMNRLYQDGTTQLWKYVNTAYLGYGASRAQEFILPPLTYSFGLITQIVQIPYNEDTFYRAFYQSVATIPGLKNDYVINLLGYIRKNYVSSSFLTAVSYNPHLLTFLYQNPEFALKLKENYDFVELFIFNNIISICITDLYKLYAHSTPSIYYTNPNISHPYNMYQIVSKSASMKSILLQNYNDMIYYTSIQSNPIYIKFILYCIQNNPLFITQMASNPNIILFLSNNVRMIQYLLDNPSAISIFTTNPNILDVKYNLVNVVLSTALESYLDPSIRALLTRPQNEILNLMNCQYNNAIVSPAQRGSLSPAVPQQDYYMVNLYYDAIMKHPSLAQLVEYAMREYAIYVNNLVYSMSDYPNMITEIIAKNPNVMTFLTHNLDICTYLLTPVIVSNSTPFTPLYRFLKIPILTNPQKDIYAYIDDVNRVEYADFRMRLNRTIYIPTELAYLNSQTVINTNPELYELINQKYNDSIYTLQLFDYTNRVISIFIENSKSLFYNLVYQNPNLINFLVYYPDLTTYLNNNPNKIPIFINIPNITNVMLNIYDTINQYNTSALLSNYITTYLGDNSLVISYELNMLLQSNPLLYVLFYQKNQYNNIYYDAMINTLLFQNLYTNTCYTYPYMMDISLKNVDLIPYLSKNSYGDHSHVLYIYSHVNTMIYEMEKLTDHMSYVKSMNQLMNQTYNNDIYERVFYYNTVYGSISRFITHSGIFVPIENMNMNILLFLYNNPGMLDFYFGEGQLSIIATNTRFRNLFNQCTDPTTNITNVCMNDLILKYYLNPNLVNGGLGSGVPINPENTNLVPLLTNYPILNQLVSQNYIFNFYFIELNNFPTLVNLLYTHTGLINVIYENPNLINFLYHHPALTIFLYNAKVCNRDYVDLITTNPNITNVYMDLLEMYMGTSLMAYLNAEYFVPPLWMKNFLDTHPTIGSIIHQQYNGNIYYTSILKRGSMISLMNNYPNMIDYINLNPNILNFMSQNPKMIDFYKFYYGDNISNLIFLYQLTQNVNIEADSRYGIIDTSTIQSSANPIIDLYKFYYQKLPQYVNNNPNILGFTNGFGSNAAVNQLLLKNGTLQTLTSQNYNYNIYKLFLLFNGSLVSLLTTYPEILFYFVYKNPNMINFLFFNTRLCQILISNPDFVAFFITLTFCQNPVLNLYDVIYQYDISNNNPIKLSNYFEKVMYLDLIGNIGPQQP